MLRGPQEFGAICASGCHRVGQRDAGRSRVIHASRPCVDFCACGFRVKGGSVRLMSEFLMDHFNEAAAGDAHAPSARQGAGPSAQLSAVIHAKHVSGRTDHGYVVPGVQGAT